MTLTDGRRPGSRGVAADHVSLRRNNLSVVLRHVRELGPRSRARIAEETGLNKATVSSLVAERAEPRLGRAVGGQGDAHAAGRTVVPAPGGQRGEPRDVRRTARDRGRIAP